MGVGAATGLGAFFRTRSLGARTGEGLDIRWKQAPTPSKALGVES